MLTISLLHRLKHFIDTIMLKWGYLFSILLALALCPTMSVRKHSLETISNKLCVHFLHHMAAGACARICWEYAPLVVVMFISFYLRLLPTERYM